MIGLPTADREIIDRLGPAVLASRILIADDEPLNLDIVGAYLRRGGFTNIELATDGVMALEKVHASRPDLLILDILMPGLSGVDVCRALRAESEFSDLPVLVVTGLDGVEDRVEIFRAGASDLLVKPINRLELIARAGVHIERRLLIGGLRRSWERIESELQVARQMQLELLPSDEQVAEMTRHGLEIASLFTTSSELGGDIWGRVDFGGDRRGIYVADFTGHGVMAALNTVRLHTLLKELRAPPDPGELLRLLNVRLVELLPPGQYATMICVAFDLAEGRLSYAAAGAPAPLLRGPGAGWRMLDSAGIPLGVTADAVYPNRSEPFAPGSLLFLYSDALAETPLTAGGLLGEAGVAALAASSPPHGAKPFLERMVGQFRAAIAGEPSDDLTCVALRRAGAVTATPGGVILP